MHRIIIRKCRSVTSIIGATAIVGRGGRTLADADGSMARLRGAETRCCRSLHGGVSTSNVGGERETSRM